MMTHSFFDILIILCFMCLNIPDVHLYIVIYSSLKCTKSYAKYRALNYLTRVGVVPYLENLPMCSQKNF